MVDSGPQRFYHAAGFLPEPLNSSVSRAIGLQQHALPQPGHAGRLPQKFQRAIASNLGIGETLERRAGNPDGRSVLIKRAPGRHIAGPTLEAFTVVASIADDK